jgi:uncharacterized protein YoaH (UPF0181 family)
MTAKERLIKKIAQSMEDAPDAFFRGVKKAQREAFAQIVSEIATLATDDAGNLLVSQGNFNKIQALVQKMKAAYMNKDYSKAIRDFVGSIDATAQDTGKLMGIITKEVFVQSATAGAILSNAKTTVFDLLANAAVNDSVESFKQILNTSISTGENFQQVIRNIRNNIEGTPEFAGRMERYAKQNAYDFYSISNAQYIRQVSEDYGFEFYEYIGVDVKGTRSFCKTRNGKIYHKREIQEWASLDWDGKNRGTDASTIFAYRGGYNCGHQIIPVATEDVPEDVLNRAIAAGFYTPEEE